MPLSESLEAGTPEDGAAIDDAALTEDAAPDMNGANTDDAGTSSCAEPCTNLAGTAECVNGSCVLACSAGYADCDGDNSNGCESNLDLDAEHCGACGNTCVAGAQTCASGVCKDLPCASGRAECDSNLTQFCETDLTSSAQDCGFCGNVCTAAHGSSSCSASSCRLTSCAPNYADCDGSLSNGCEADLLTSAQNCGQCGVACSNSHGSSACVNGACAPQCDAGYADCDGSSSNGCETNVALDPTHCGSCGKACDLATQTCKNGTCQTSPCPAGRAECDNNLTQFCETDTTSSSQNCGFCGNACAASNGTSACSASSCVLTGCNPNYANCDASASNGCEAPLLTSLQHCGGCGVACLNANGTTACVNAVCAPQCSAGYADCDGNVKNGCETPLNTIANCGSCGKTCPANGGTPSCNAGTCVTTCDMTGRWALRLTVPTTWPATSVLSSGSGNFTFWALLDVVQSGGSLTGSVSPCGETAPDFRAAAWIGERYGVVLPNALFDGALLPGVAASGAVGSAQPGSAFTLNPTAFLTGASMASPVSGAWPSASMLTSLDSDGDGKPAITAPYASGSGYSAPPANSLGTVRAQAGYIATRVVFSLSGTLDTCSAASGTVSAQDIDFHTLGCRTTSSRDCSATEANYLDANGPNYVTSSGPYALAKLAATATCAAVRAALP